MTITRRARWLLLCLLHLVHGVGDGKEARIAEPWKDCYGRTLGRVFCVEVDANAEQMRRGMAWVFERYAPKDSPLYGLQSEARAAKRGLWQDAKPVPPWEWRQAQRQ